MSMSSDMNESTTTSTYPGVRYKAQSRETSYDECRRFRLPKSPAPVLNNRHDGLEYLTQSVSQSVSSQKLFPAHQLRKHAMILSRFLGVLYIAS